MLRTKTTKQDKLVAALENMGCKNITKQFKTSKYLVFSRPSDSESFYFVGSAGALRVGKTVSDSFGCSEANKKYILNKYGRNI